MRVQYTDTLLMKKNSESNVEDVTTATDCKK